MHRLRALSVQPETVSGDAQQKLTALLQKSNSLNLAMRTATKADFKSVASMLNNRSARSQKSFRPPKPRR